MKKTKKTVRKHSPEIQFATHQIEKIAHRLDNTGLKEFNAYLHSPMHIMWSNFLAGTFRGLGFFLGASLVLTIFAVIVTRVLANIPVVGEFFATLLQFLQENTHF